MKESCKSLIPSKPYLMLINRFNAHAAKITGMFLELSIEEIVDLINDEGKLRGKMDEAIKLLKGKDE